MDTVLRSFAADIDDVNKAERSIVAKISVGCVDRYRTVIEPAGISLKEFQANPVVLFAHGKDPLRGELPVGRNLWIKLDRSGNGRLIAKTKFAKDDFSQTLYELYADGTMRGWSVSILPTEFGEPTKEEIRSRPDLEKCEIVFRASNLMEYSCVSVPGCAEALSIDEARSVSVMISRGIPVPNEITEALKQFSETLAVQESTGLILPEDAIEDRPVDEEERNHKCSEPEDEDDEEEEDEEEVKKKKEKERAAESEEPALPTIELPPLNGRTFQQVYWRLMQDEAEFRSKVLEELNARIDWMCGKV